MGLHTIDWGIIILYLSSIVLIGWFLRKKAAQNLDTYFLGAKSLPWYLLGLSNASGMFDISGTMWLVTLAFVYGLKSIWIPWLWPVFNQIFLMIYLSIWLRRSQVLTGAEWIRFRFGDGLGASLSHGIVVVFALISALGFLSYGFIGIGKFIEVLIPWSYVADWFPWQVSPQNLPYIYGAFFTVLATFYVVLGGMFSIVWTDVLQFIILFLSSFVVGIIAMQSVDSSTLQQVIPEGWLNPFFSWRLNLDWQPILPAVNDKIQADGFSLFSLFFMMMLFKGILASMAGPAPNYDMQKILSTRSPQEAAKMSGLVSLVLLFPRYFMIMGFTVLALVFFREDFQAMHTAIDFEKVLPLAIHKFIPVGFKGLLLAGLLAAFMSTFASTINAAPAYLIHDIYLRYINPQASTRKLIYASYAISIVVVLLSTFIGLYLKDINSVLQWIVSALYGGYIAANLLKWHWWRFNGQGYFWGMLVGIIAALIFPLLFDTALSLYYFPWIFLISLLACIIGTYSAPPTEDSVLLSFYRQVRPWGFWQPIAQKVMMRDPHFVPNTNFKRDMFNIGVGIIWQTCLVVIPIYLILREEIPLLSSLIILLITSLILKKNWYDHLAQEKD